MPKTPWLSSPGHRAFQKRGNGPHLASREKIPGAFTIFKITWTPVCKKKKALLQIYRDFITLDGIPCPKKVLGSVGNLARIDMCHI